MTPDTKFVHDGMEVKSRSVSSYGPASCFCTRDLYTTQYGEILNDEVERHLFGSIDTRGSKAVSAYISGDFQAMHDSFMALFEYLDAQKIRTPKGLDWIRSQYPTLSQIDLMREMQALRLMHCTMWTESVREIVSAEDSDVKFAISDHPITIYNPSFPPDSPHCDYPNDAAFELVGSQTIFALDCNHCLILTHLEYAENPDGASLDAPRTNARYRGASIARTDAIIRTRKLTREEVIAVNYVLKSRAKRYFAAGRRDWLFPEQSFAGRYSDVAKILLPKDELWRFGGEIYIRYDDGHVHYQDQFGRTSDSHKYLSKATKPRKLGSNEPCGCGSGQKFKRCCKDLPEKDRPSWSVCGIRERNIILCNAVTEILELNSGITWDDVRARLNVGHVRDIHGIFRALWPPDTDLVNLLPRPSKSRFRAVYLGMTDARTFASSITCWLPYFEELVVAHPFLNATRLRPKFSPIAAPEQYLEQTLRNVYLLLALEPFIHSGQVHLVPDPSDYNEEFARTTREMVEPRADDWHLDDESERKIQSYARAEFESGLRRLPEQSLRRQIRNAAPNLGPDEISDVVQYLKAEWKNDPLSLLQPLEAGESKGQMRFMKGFNLESSLYVAILTGSAIFTDLPAHWGILHRHAADGANPPVIDDQQVLASAIYGIEFPLESDFRAAFDVRKSGKCGPMRSGLAALLNAARDGTAEVRSGQLCAQMQLAAQYMQSEWRDKRPLDLETGRLQISMPHGGFASPEVRRLLLTFGRTTAINPVPLALLGSSFAAIE